VFYISGQTIFYGEVLLALRSTPSWRITPGRLSATVYSTHFQLPSTSGVRLLYPQPENVPWRGDDMDPLNMEFSGLLKNEKGTKYRA